MHITYFTGRAVGNTGTNYRIFYFDDSLVIVIFSKNPNLSLLSYLNYHNEMTVSSFCLCFFIMMTGFLVFHVQVMLIATFDFRHLSIHVTSSPII